LELEDVNVHLDQQFCQSLVIDQSTKHDLELWQSAALKSDVFVFQRELRPISGEARRRNPDRGQSAALKSDV
jgi:hypothetical protein